MTLLKTNGPGGDLILPEHNDLEWVQSVLSELQARLDVLEDAVDESGYRVHEECRTLVNGLVEYHGAA